MLRQRGLTLIELIVFIVLVAVAFGALVLSMNQFLLHSADPLLRKQALAIAESLLEEVQLMPFTFCDPDDANASIATNSIVGDPNGCATLTEDAPIGPNAGESRGHAVTPFDNVSDYHGYATGPIVDISGTAVGGLANYSASITVTQTALGGIAATESLRIVVTVTPPSGDNVVLEGYRTRYAPRTSQ